MLSVIFITSYAGNFNGQEYKTKGTVYGSELACINIATQLTKWYKVTVFVNGNVDLVQDDVRYVGWSRYDEICKKNKPDICVVSRYINFWIHNVNYAKKTYLWCHDTYIHSALQGKMLPENGTPLLMNLLGGINKIVCVGNEQKKTFFDHIPDNKKCVIPNGINIKRKYKLKEKVPNSFVFCSSPSLKHLKYALQVFPKVSEILEGATLSIYYSELDDECKKLMENQPNVTWYGKVSHEEMIDILYKTEYWLYPTRFFETCCTVTYETGYCGCIQITSNVGALKENVKGIIIDEVPGTPSFEIALINQLKVLSGPEGEKEKLKILSHQYQWCVNQTWEKRGLMWKELFTSDKIVNNAIQKCKPYKMCKDPSKPTLAATIMMKNEEDSIMRTLKSTVDYVDSYVFYDTGSTDNTLKVCKKFCEEHNKNCFIKQGKFVDFEVSRNVLLNFANDKADYLLLLDSADELEKGDILLSGIKQIFTSGDDCSAFYITQRWYTQTNQLVFKNIRLIRTRRGWKYEFPVHEYLTGPYSKKAAMFLDVVIKQDRIMEAGKSEKRWVKDKIVLLKYMLKHPKSLRGKFYLAQTCKCLNQWDAAYVNYLNRTEYGGFRDEIEQSYLELYKMNGKTEKVNKEKGIGYLKILWNKFKRGEAAYFLAKEHFESGEIKEAYNWAITVCECDFPSHISLWVERNIYDVDRWSLLGKICKSLLESNNEETVENLLSYKKNGLFATGKALSVSKTNDLANTFNFLLNK